MDGLYKQDEGEASIYDDQGCIMNLMADLSGRLMVGLII
jgi:hypothetical protein